MAVKGLSTEVIGLALLGVSNAFAIWSAANPSVFTVSQFTTEQSKENARLGMNLGLGLTTALSAGLYFAYGKKGVLPSILTEASGVGLYALYEYLLSKSHITNPHNQTMAQQAQAMQGGDVPWAGVPGNPGLGPTGGPGGISKGDPSQPGAVRENWGEGNFPSRGGGYANIEGAPDWMNNLPEGRTVYPGNPGLPGGGGGGGGAPWPGATGGGGGGTGPNSGQGGAGGDPGIASRGSQRQNWGEGNFPSRGGGGGSRGGGGYSDDNGYYYIGYDSTTSYLAEGQGIRQHERHSYPNRGYDYHIDEG